MCDVFIHDTYMLNNIHGGNNIKSGLAMSLSISNRLLNQAHAWFLKLISMRIVGMRVHVCVCVFTPWATNN